ncbi:carboxyltransferase domain-containing protein [Microbacterium schleiferi]|uniref:carboxyltransferase domain-containing protein n=1 Tax=Microbacterium schleiferi TaxID=69362 RepID=UPI00226D1527|nr:carboxyltransferase domain-containing protein [Microbacterium schleiferi]
MLGSAEALRVVIALRERLELSRPDGVVDLVPAARTVLVRFTPSRVAASVVRAWIEKSLADALAAATPEASPQPPRPATRTSRSASGMTGQTSRRPRLCSASVPPTSCRRTWPPRGPSRSRASRPGSGTS